MMPCSLKGTGSELSKDGPLTPSVQPYRRMFRVLNVPLHPWHGLDHSGWIVVQDLPASRQRCFLQGNGAPEERWDAVPIKPL